MSEYEAFGRMERSNWSQSTKVLNYVNLFSSVTDQTIDSILETIKIENSHKALDVCCGQGNLSAALKAKGYAVSGLDFSPAMLEMARQRVPEVNFVDGDAQNLPFSDNQFDVVVSNLGICHVPNQPRALSEVHRTLYAGGKFAMTVWCGPDISPCFELFYGAVKAFGNPDASAPSGPDFHQFSKLEIARKLFSEAGFTEIHFSVIECSLNSDNPEQLCEIFEKATVRGSMLLASQPPECLDSIRMALASAVQERFRSGERWCVPMPAAMISACKL